MKDEILSAYIFDLQHYFKKADYLRAAQCAACLLIELSSRADIKPASILKAYQKSGRK